MNRPHDDFFIKRPEIFEAAAAARDDEAVDLNRKAIGGGNGGSDFGSRAFTLHPCRHHDHVGPAPAPREDLEEIANRRAARARHNGNPPREGRQ